MPSENVLVTGGTSGIGLELAKCFAESGSNLILVARNEHRLQHLAQAFRTEYGVEARAVAKDLSIPAAPQELYSALLAEEVPVHVLVNSAGFAAYGDFAELSLERQMDMVQVNVTALSHLSRLFLPDMLQRGRGGILNVGSTAGFQPGPNLAVYHATKAYVLSLTEGLAGELRGSGVTATCLAPGMTRTNFQREAGAEDTLLVRLGLQDVETVARAGYTGFRKGRTVVVPGLANKAGAVAVRLAPRAITRRVVHLLHR